MMEQEVNSLDGDTGLYMNTYAFLAMAVHPELRIRFINAYAQRMIKHLCFKFEKLDGAARSLVHAGLITMDEILDCTRQSILHAEPTRQQTVTFA
jgi:hypothetical protein